MGLELKTYRQTKPKDEGDQSVVYEMSNKDFHWILATDVNYTYLYL